MSSLGTMHRIKERSDDGTQIYTHKHTRTYTRTHKYPIERLVNLLIMRMVVGKYYGKTKRKGE